MTIFGQGGHFVDFSFFALNISETSNKHSDKFFSTFEVDKMSKPNFSRACIFFARCNSMAFAKVPSKDWPLSRKKNKIKKSEAQLSGALSQRILGRFFWNSARLKVHTYSSEKCNKRFLPNFFFLYYLLILWLIYIV